MTVTVSAAELSTKTISEANAEDVTIQPRGSLSGYGHEWHGGGSGIAMFPDNADRWLNGNNEDKNIPLFNVSPGTYRLYYQCYFGDSGTVHCWVY